MIAAIVRACRLLSEPSAKPIEVARGLGEIARGAEGDHEIVVKPSDSSVGAATVVARIDAPETDVVVLDPASGTTLTVSQLASVFGTYREGPRTQPSAPRRVIFYPDVRGPTHRCAVIADVRVDRAPISEGTVERVMVRRDPILG